MQIFLPFVFFNGLLLLTMYLEHTKRQVEVFFLSRNAFIFPNVYHRSLVFVTSKVREVFQALLGEGNRLNGPQSRVNKIGFWLQASIFLSKQVLIILPSAPKLTATTNNENTHQQFIFRSVQSVSSSNPEIADKVILGKEISKSVKCFPKTDVLGLWPFVSVRKKPEIWYRQFFTDRDWAVQSHAVNNCITF